MDFKFKDYESDQTVVMHCKTRAEAVDFCQKMHDAGKTWRSGGSYIDSNCWVVFKDNTVYYFNEGRYGSLGGANCMNRTILEWSDFMENKFTKKDLRTGMLIENRIGDLYIVGESVEGHKILAGNPSRGYYWLNDFEDNLLNKSKYYNEDADIMKVYSLSQFHSNNYTLSKGGRSILFERKEKVELTLDEIADKFGIRVEDLKIKK